MILTIKPAVYTHKYGLNGKRSFLKKLILRKNQQIKHVKLPMRQTVKGLLYKMSTQKIKCANTDKMALVLQ